MAVTISGDGTITGANLAEAMPTNIAVAQTTDFIITDGEVPQKLISVTFTANKDNPLVYVMANTCHAIRNNTDRTTMDIDPAAGIGWKVGGDSFTLSDYEQFHLDTGSRQNIDYIGEFYVQDTTSGYSGISDAWISYEQKPVVFSGGKVLTGVAKGDSVTLALWVESDFELTWGRSWATSSNVYQSSIIAIQS